MTQKEPHRPDPQADDLLHQAILRDRTDNPAPRLSDAALERVMADAPKARNSGFNMQRLGETLREAAGSLLRPPAWQALAAASVAGLVAGSFLPAGQTSQSLSPEEEFAAYLNTADTYEVFLEEDI